MHTITLNNIPLLASSPIQWSLRSGVRPTTMEYEMSPSSFVQFIESLGQSNSVILRIETDSGTVLEVKNLYFLGNSIGANDFIKKVIIADRRWLWDRHAIYRKYNIRRHVGVKRLKAIDVKELQDVAPAVRYARYSVKSADAGTVTKWTTKDIIEDVVKELVNFEKGFNPGATGWTFRTEFKKDIPVENLMLDDPGGSALNKALSFVAGAEIYIDYDGRIVVYDKSAPDERNAELSVISQFNRTKIAGFGNIVDMDKSFLRPKEIRVMFHREIEVRFDATEAEATIAYAPNKRSMDNVISLPDWELDGQIQGTWINLPTALAQWNGLDKPAGIIAEFSLAYLRKAFVPFLDFWSPFLLNGVLAPKWDWASRVAAIMMHWRQTFRVNPNWIDRVSTLKAYRVATIDPVTGQRAPAIAYANYSQLYTERSFYFELADHSPNSYCANYEVGLLSDDIAILPTNSPAPAKVSVVDSDQGIIHLDFLADVYRLRENTIPGLIGIPGNPGAVITSDITRAGLNSIAFDAIGDKGGGIPEIIDGRDVKPHVTTIILTAISAAPNDNRQYHVVVKKPENLKDLPSMRATGPPMEIIIGSAIETARVRWLDIRKEDIEKLFGVGLTPVPKAGEEIELSKAVDDLVINRGGTGTATESYASLDEIARAVAYRIYLSLSDRMAGSAATRLRSDLTLRGYLDEVSQEINPDGVAVTRISSPTEIPELDLFALLDNNTRAIIMRLAEVGK